MAKKDDIKLVEQLRESRDAISAELGKRIIGQHEIIEHILITLFCQGHALIIGVPGLAKTLLIKSVSEILDLKFSRIQFTPDLMPSDITGTEILEEDHATGKREFKFFQGPLFANIILADEINRTPPKTQAALLEAMQEHKVTAAGVSYTLDEPFLVLATQNPIEQEGTYPLPEAQLDRFMFSLNITYPSRKDEIEIVKSTTSGPDKSLKSTITKDDILTFQSLVRRVPVADNVVEFAVDLAAKTRPEDGAPQFISDWLEWGAGPRASQYLILGAKAKAILDGRPTPDISDVIAMAKPVLRHRIITSFNAEADGVNADQVLDQLIQKSA
ncbi:MAG: AAA family ATPase [Candidatus Marinimicrobia bacterium]|uniref:AAA+ ATPase domain-containing protein n=1 Tax=marine metagenome TaxID=408172 RepID=A0A381SUE8_9ZZZZ|nr:AAA family ATPase [Candidatus Neomarinimicrobiota bacterium]